MFMEHDKNVETHGKHVGQILKRKNPTNFSSNIPYCVICWFEKRPERRNSILLFQLEMEKTTEKIRSKEPHEWLLLVDQRQFLLNI